MENIFSFFTGSVFPIIVSLLVFSILVVVHELGHFMLAKKNGIKVEEFAIGMGPILFKKQHGETLYSLRALPIGGFCRMLGEDGEAEDEKSFSSKSVLARISVIVAGPMMNFIFAFVLVLLLLGANGYIEPVVTKLSDGYSAQEAGLKTGDKIVKIDGQSVLVYNDLQMIMLGQTGEEIEVVVKRGAEKLSYQITPKISPETGGYILGFTPEFKSGLFAKPVEGISRASVIDTMKNSFNTMIFYVKSTVVGFVRIFSFQVSKDEISGPIGIIQVMGDYYESGIKDSVFSAVKNMASLAALLSANLGALNLFPIPAMDGGRLVFLILEGIRRKPINPEKEGMIHFAGFVLLMAFMAFIAFNDVSRIFLG